MHFIDSVQGRAQAKVNVIIDIDYKIDNWESRKDILLFKLSLVAVLKIVMLLDGAKHASKFVLHTYTEAYAKVKH